MSVLAILGAGGHAKVVADAALASSLASTVEFFSDSPSSLASGDTDDLIASSKRYEGVVIAIGDNGIRASKYQELSRAGIHFVSVFHPSAIVSPSAEIGEGTVVFAGAVINPDAKVEANCIINSGCVIEHDCVLAQSVHISPKAALGGGVSIGTRSWVGIGATVKHGINVAPDVVVGAGGVVVSDIKNAGIYVGVPVKQV